MKSALYKIALQRKVSGVTSSVSGALEDEPEDTSSGSTGSGRLGRAEKQRYEALAVQFGNQLSIELHSSQWQESMKDAECTVHYLSHRAVPVCSYRCVGLVRVPVSVTGPTLAALFVDIPERRRWDKEVQHTSKTLCTISKTVTLEHVVHASGLGGLVSSRDYVDLYATDEQKETQRTHYRAFWASVKWDEVLDSSCVRGWNYPQGASFCQLEPGVWQLTLHCHRDVKGWLPYAAAENATPGSLLAEWKQFRDFVQRKYT